MLLTERDRYSKLYSGYDIQWMNWANYMPALVCRCAKKALENGYKYFGIEFWGMTFYIENTFFKITSSIR